jgi:hypothetical protein
MLYKFNKERNSNIRAEKIRMQCIVNATREQLSVYFKITLI